MENRRDVVGVAEEEIGGVDEGMIFFFGGDGEATEDGFGEGIMDGAAFGRVLADRAVIEIFLDEQDFGAAAFKADDAGGTELATVEADVIVADAGGEAALVEEFSVPFVDFEPEFALPGVPVEVEVAGEFLE